MNELLNQHPWLIIFLVVIGYYLLRVVFLAREGVRHFLRALIASVAFGIIGFAIAPELGFPRREQAEAVATIAAVIAFIAMPKRSRYIPAEVRREVVARHRKRTGEAYDPSEHDLDHIVPFSKGGSHSPENLRVVPKKVNRQRGAKMPGLRDII
jgi:hypothetical protein